MEYGDYFKTSAITRMRSAACLTETIVKMGGELYIVSEYLAI